MHGIGQNVDACVTTFGKTDSVSTETETAFKLKATAGFGLKVTGGVVAQSEADFTVKFGAALSRATSHQNTLSKNVTYSTGPMEDTIVFAVVPYHRFLYRIRAAFDETMLGGIVSVFVPRPPVVLQAERGFYNDHVLDESDKIGPEVFSHRVGDIDSYPTRGDVARLLAENCEARDFPPCTALETGPQAVGQGSGSTQLGIEVGTADGVKGELALSASIETETTIATVKVTLELESEVAFSIGATVAESVAFTGSVGSIGASQFADNSYSFGMFSYAYGDRGRFDVVDYWVEK
jgi:hypothetical protein